MKYYNSNPEYGDAGPFNAESPRDLADEMSLTFGDWADQSIEKFDDEVRHHEAEAADRPDRDELIAEMREEFIAALEPVND